MRISPVIVTFAPHKQNIDNKYYYDYGKEMALYRMRLHPRRS